jgi:hypothetical protein
MWHLIKSQTGILPVSGERRFYQILYICALGQLNLVSSFSVHIQQIYLKNLIRAARVVSSGKTGFRARMSGTVLADDSRFQQISE